MRFVMKWQKQINPKQLGGGVWMILPEPVAARGSATRKRERLPHAVAVPPISLFPLTQDNVSGIIRI